jgi:ketosteroid isomerase-like protein
MKSRKLIDMTKTEIAKAFSNGEFEKTNKFISDTAIWTVVEEDTFIGKQAVIENCEQVSSYFQSVITDFKTLNIITEGNKVVINGTAEFLRDNKRVSFVSACDVYEFDDNNQIQNITSYCIQKVKND